MKTTIPASVRWLLLVPVALLATAITQVLLFQVFCSILLSIFGLDVNSVVWISRSITAPFMGAVFVSVFWLIAPSNNYFAAITSLFVVAVRGIRLMAGGVSGGFVRVFLMGALGLVGAMAAFFVLRDRHIPYLRWAS